MSETRNLLELYGSYDDYHETVTQKITERIYWDDPRLAEIVRLRLLSDLGFGFWDIAYCHGRLKDGSFVDVELPDNQIPKGRIKETIINWAKKDDIYAKGLNIFNVISNNERIG